MPEPTPQHLRWPPAIVRQPNGAVAFAVVEQGSREEILRGVGLLCELRPGDLPWDPTLGIPDPLGTTDPIAATAAIERAITNVEGRLPIAVDVLDTPTGRSLRPRIHA